MTHDPFESIRSHLLKQMQYYDETSFGIEQDDEFLQEIWKRYLPTEDKPQLYNIKSKKIKRVRHQKRDG